MKLAINGGSPVRTKPFPQWPIWDETEEQNLLCVLKSGKWGSTRGNEARMFEREFADYQGAKYGIATTNGTSALEIAVRSTGIEAGDEVLVPAYTFIATAIAILNNGAIPVFVDIDPQTYNIDPDGIEGLITEKTRAILPVHFAGRPADMDRIEKIAEKHGLSIVEDAAQGWGGQWQGKGVGTFGHFGSFSFQASKNITAGEGGIILTDSDELARLANSYTNCGRLTDGLWYAHYLLAGNERMTEFQSAILRAQLSRYPAQLARRQANMAVLDNKLTALPGVEPLKSDARITSHACHIYIFRYRPKIFDGLAKEKFIEALRAEGIPCSSGYSIPLYEQPLFKKREFGPFKKMLESMVDYDAIHLPHTERACKEEAIWLEQRILLEDNESMQYIADAIGKIYELREELA